MSLHSVIFLVRCMVTYITAECRHAVVIVARCIWNCKAAFPIEKAVDRLYITSYKITVYMILSYPPVAMLPVWLSDTGVSSTVLWLSCDTHVTLVCTCTCSSTPLTLVTHVFAHDTHTYGLNAVMWCSCDTDLIQSYDVHVTLIGSMQSCGDHVTLMDLHAVMCLNTYFLGECFDVHK